MPELLADVAVARLVGEQHVVALLGQPARSIVAWVDLPAPSPPSNATKTPAFGEDSGRPSATAQLVHERDTAAVVHLTVAPVDTDHGGEDGRNEES